MPKKTLKDVDLTGRIVFVRGVGEDRDQRASQHRDDRYHDEQLDQHETGDRGIGAVGFRRYDLQTEQTFSHKGSSLTAAGASRRRSRASPPQVAQVAVLDPQVR